jgi:hypothetical protein
MRGHDDDAQAPHPGSARTVGPAEGDDRAGEPRVPRPVDHDGGSEHPGQPVDHDDANRHFGDRALRRGTVEHHRGQPGRQHHVDHDDDDHDDDK